MENKTTELYHSTRIYLNAVEQAVCISTRAVLRNELERIAKEYWQEKCVRIVRHWKLCDVTYVSTGYVLRCEYTNMDSDGIEIVNITVGVCVDAHVE
jgi:hypothetical protein